MDGEILERAKQITAEIKLCNHCLGRLFLEVEGKDNEERGQKIRAMLKQDEPEECELCKGFFKRVDEVTWNAAKELGSYDFRTIIVASKVPKDVLEREIKIWEKFSVKQSESINIHNGRSYLRHATKEGGTKNNQDCCRGDIRSKGRKDSIKGVERGDENRDRAY